MTDEEHIRRLIGSAPSSARRLAALTANEPQPAAPRQTPRPERDWAQEARAQEARRQREAQRDAERQQAYEQRRRAERTRALIQQLKFLIIDCYFPSDPIPTEALAEAKEEIERKLGLLPILELPLWELQQHATVVRDRIYRRYCQPPASPEITAAPRRDMMPTTVHNPLQEVTIMPMHKILSGYFICPACEEEFDLDRVPEKDAVCADCRVPLEELDEEDDEGDDEA